MMRPAVPLGTMALFALLTACDGARPVEPALVTVDTPVSAKDVDFELELVREVRALAQQNRVGPLATRPRYGSRSSCLVRRWRSIRSSVVRATSHA